MLQLAYFQVWLCLLLCGANVDAQGPNTLARYNHNHRTQSNNGTWFIVPIDKSKVAQAVKKYPLGPVPRHDKRLFPKGFPAGKHPVIVTTTYENDIRRGNLEIDNLMGGAVYVPYVDRLGDGTPFLYAPVTYLGGANGQEFMGVVPALVGSINTEPIKLGNFTPNDAAYLRIGDNSFSSQVKKVVAPNPVTGPGISPSAIDLLFHTTKKSMYTARAFRQMLNQPTILQNAQANCQRNIYFFNESFANPIFQTGQVTLYPDGVPKSLAGVYKNVGGYSANGELLGYNNQDCREAANAPKPA